MNYYQFHISDWSLHTNHLTLEEEAVYRRLLDFYYDTEQAIPEITQPVIRRLRLGSYQDIVGLILNEFFKLKSDGWHNLRADSEILMYKNKAERARVNGKGGGRPKKQKQEKQEKQTVINPNNPEITQLVILDNPEITGSKANQEPLTINQEPLTINHKPINKGKEEKKKTVSLSINEQIKQKPDDADSELWEECVNERKRRKATQTQRALDGFIRDLDECSKNNIPKNKAITVFLENSWKGIKFGWIESQASSQPKSFNVAQGDYKSQALRNTPTLRR